MRTTPGTVIGDLDLNDTDSDGVEWYAAPPDDGSPGSTLTLSQKPRGHGAWAGAAYMRPRHIAVEGRVLASSPEALNGARDRLIAAVSLYETVVTFREPGRERWVNARREGEVLWRQVGPVGARWSVQLAAPDPRKFGDAITESTGLPSSTGGVTFPLTFPLTFTATTASGQVSLTNPGNETGPLLIRIDGPSNPLDPPLVGPVVTHATSGLSLVFSTSLTLGYGEFITIDPEVPEVLAQGQSSRNGWVLSRGWPGFEAGVNTYSFSAVSGPASARMTVTAIPAWQ